jgi:hypothetical protein
VLPVGQIRRHDEVVLDDEASFLAVHDESFDDLGDDQSLL